MPLHPIIARELLRGLVALDRTNEASERDPDVRLGFATATRAVAVAYSGSYLIWSCELRTMLIALDVTNAISERNNAIRFGFATALRAVATAYDETLPHRIEISRASEPELTA